MLTRNPLYSSPHLRRTKTGFPVSSCKNGFGLTGETYEQTKKYARGRKNGGDDDTYGRHDCSREEGTRGLVKSIKRASHPLLDALTRLAFPRPRHVRPRGPLWPPTHRRRSLAPQGHRRKNDLRFVGLLCALRRPLNVRDPDKKPPLSHATYTHLSLKRMHARTHILHVSRTSSPRCRLCQGDTRLDHRMLRRSVQTYLMLQSLFSWQIDDTHFLPFPVPCGPGFSSLRLFSRIYTSHFF